MQADGIQKLLVVVIVTLTLLLLVAGVQVILIISDIKKAVKKINTILEDSIIGGGLIRPDRLTGILEMFRKKKKVEKHGNNEY